MSLGLGLPTSAPSGGVNLTANTIGSGLAALLQGLVQGKEIGLQQQMQRQQISDDQTRNATDLLPLYQQMARLGVNIDPSKANAALAPLGINLGNQVPQNFGQIDPAQLLQNPQTLQELGALSPEMRGIFKPLVGNTLPPAFWSAPQRMEPQQATQVLNDLRMQRYELLMQGGDPNSQAIKNIDSQMTQIEQSIPGFPQTPGVDTSTAFGSGPTKAQSNIAYTGARTQMTNDQDKKVIAQTQWIAPLNQSIIGRNKSQTFYYDSQGAAVPVKLAQGWAKIKVAQENADTHAGELTNAIQRTMIAAKNADTNATRTANDAYNKALVQIRSDEGLKRSYAAQMSLLQQANPNVDLSQNQSFQALKANYQRINNRLYQEQQFAKNYPALVKSIGTQVIHKQGAPPSFSAAPNTGSPAPSGHDLAQAITTLKGMPRAQALQAIATATKYTPAEKAQLRASLSTP